MLRVVFSRSVSMLLVLVKEEGHWGMGAAGVRRQALLPELA
jgi:hypothetical protein